MAQVTPEDLGLGEFSPENSDKALQYLQVYFTKLLQTGGVTLSGEVEVKNEAGNPIPVQGTVAEGQPATGNPVREGWMAQDPASPPAAEAALDIVTPSTDLQKRPLVRQADLSGDYDAVRPFSLPVGDWSYPAAAAGISNTTTAVTIKAAGGGSVRNYITAVQIYSDALGAATELAIRDGAAGTVLWRTKIGTGGRINGDPIIFPTPLRGTANTLLEVVTLTASITGAVYFNAQGYSSTV